MVINGVPMFQKYFTLFKNNSLVKYLSLNFLQINQIKMEHWNKRGINVDIIGFIA